MLIRHAEEKDFNRMMEIYRFAREFMAETGNPNQWGPTNWPPEDLIHDDIKQYFQKRKHRNGGSYWGRLQAREGLNFYQ